MLFIYPQAGSHSIPIPFGIVSTPKLFQKHVSQILEGIEGCVCLIDDVLIYGKDKEHNRCLKAVLERLKEKDVTLNRQKCEFGKQSLQFLSHILDNSGVRPDPDKMSAIREMQPPRNISEVRRFLGMVNQMGKFSPNLTRITQSLRELLKKKQSWIRSEAQALAFAEVKEQLTKPIVLSRYDLKADTTIATDASSYGLGAVLLQKTPQSQWTCCICFPIDDRNRTSVCSNRERGLGHYVGCEKFST